MGMTRAEYAGITIPVAFCGTITWFGVFTMVNAYLTKGLHYTDEEWAGAILWLTGGIVFWLLSIGFVTTKIGRRQTLALSMALSGACFGVIAMTGQIRVIAPMLGLMAIVQSATSIIFLTLITRHTGAGPGRAIAVFQWITTALTIVSLIVGGYLMEWAYFRATFLGISALVLISACVFYRASRALAIHDHEPVVGFLSLNAADRWLFLKAPFLPVILLGICGETWYFVMINQLFRNLAKEHFDLSESAIGWIVALGRLPSLLSLYLLTHRADHVNVRLVYGVGIIAGSVCSIGVGWAPTAWMMVIAYSIYYVGQGLVWGVNVTTVASAVPMRLRESAQGLLVIVQMGTAMLVGAVQHAMLAAGMQLRWIYTTCALVGLACGIGLVIYAIRRPGTAAGVPEPVS